MIRILISIFALIIVLNSANSQELCTISDLNVTVLPCNSADKFAVKLDFNHEHTGNQGFKIQGNGHSYGTFSYDELPVILDGLAGNCETQYEFVVRDIEHPNCADDAVIGKICCEDDCKLEAINIKVSDCIENSFYKIGFDLLSTGTKKLGFDFYANNEYVGFYKYNQLPLENIQLPISNNAIDTFIVCENDNIHCCDTFTSYNACECNIYNIRSQVIECSEDSEKYWLRINFDHTQTNDSFLLGGSSNLIGVFAFKDLPIVTGPYNFGQIIDELLIADVNNILCFNSFTPPVIEHCQSCGIEGLQYDVTACNDEGKLYVKLQFDEKNVGVNGFKVRGNGVVYGENYQYGEETYFIGPITPDCDKIYEFVVIDNSNPNCAASLHIENHLCCDFCTLHDMTVISHCETNAPSAKIEYNGSASSDSMYVLVNNIIVDKVPSTENPIIISYNFINNTTYKVSLVAHEDESCNQHYSFKYNCNDSDDCNFSNIVTNLTECNDEDQFFLRLKFDINGNHTSKFKVQVNDQFFGPYEYGKDLYEIGPVNHACNTIRIVIYDTENEDCKKVIEINEDKCCDESHCNLQQPIVKAVCFEGNIIGLQVLVEGTEGNAYNFYLDNAFVGKYKYSDLPFLINKGLERGFHEIRIVDVVNNECEIAYQLLINCDNCYYYNFTAFGVECTEETAQFLIDFEYENNPQDSFFVRINDERFGPYAYGDLPLVIDKIYNPSNDLTYNFTILDQQETCGLKQTIHTIDCLSGSNENENLKQIKIFKNFDRLHVVLPDSKVEHNVQVLAIDGRLVTEVKTTTTTIELTVPTHQILIVKVFNGKQFFVKKV